MRVLFLSAVMFCACYPAFSADWRCGSLAKSELNIAYLNVEADPYGSPYTITPANEVVDDFLNATTAKQICVKGRLIGTHPTSVLAYDIKEN